MRPAAVLRAVIAPYCTRTSAISPGRSSDARTLPDVETAQLEEGSENPKDGMVAVRLPPRSFTVIEAAMTDR